MTQDRDVKPPPQPTPISNGSAQPISETACFNCLGLGSWSRTERDGLGTVAPTERVITLYCTCPAGAAAQARHEERQAEIVWDAAGVPRRFKGLRLETSPWLKKRPDLIASLRESAASWFFWGPVGTGKTGLATSFARVWAEEGAGSIRFKTVPDLLSELRDTYSRREGSESEADLLHAYRHCELLVLDDLGAEHAKDTGWLEDRLYQIIGHRHANDEATVFTSNLSLSELEQHIGARNIWRIAEMCKGRVVKLDGENLRAGGG